MSHETGTDFCASTPAKLSIPPIGRAPLLPTKDTVLHSTTLRTDSLGEVWLYEVADERGAIRTVLWAEGPVELSMGDAVALAGLLINRNTQVPAGSIREEPTLSAVEVLALARGRGATHVVEGVVQGSLHLLAEPGAIKPLDGFLPYGKPPAQSCARFAEVGPSHFADASRPDLAYLGWRFCVLTPAGKLSAAA